MEGSTLKSLLLTLVFQSNCHFSLNFCFKNALISENRIGLLQFLLNFVAFFAALSASSLPLMSQWAGTQQNKMFVLF